MHRGKFHIGQAVHLRTSVKISGKQDFCYIAVDFSILHGGRDVGRCINYE